MIRQTAEKRAEILPADASLWRAQRGNVWIQQKCDEFDFGDVPQPLARERMKPTHEGAVEGRANPKGVAYLYLATDHDTAIGEVRPWIGAYVSVGLFKPCRELSIVNCTAMGDSIPVLIWHWPQGSPAKDCEDTLWTRIGGQFATPVTPSDNTAYYVPTQIIAELFKAEGFDGIKYRSSLGKGQNVVLFDPDAAEIKSSRLFYVKSVAFEFDEITDSLKGQE